MRIMPFYQASESVTWSDPMVVVNGEIRSLDEPLSDWDYLTPIEIVTKFQINPEQFLEETYIREAEGSPLAGIDAVAQVDCLATGVRFVGRTPANGVNGSGSVVVEIPAGEVAESLEIQLSVVLAREDEEPHGVAATRTGSRLYTHPKKFKLQLEGCGGGFPTEAFPFSDLGLPSEATWYLSFDSSRLEDSFMTGVRLFVNTDHPRSADLLSNSDETLRSVLFTDIFGELIGRVALLDDTSQLNDFVEDSTGYVLNELTQVYLGRGLAEVVEDLRKEPARMRAKIQSATSFLAEAGK